MDKLKLPNSIEPENFVKFRPQLFELLCLKTYKDTYTERNTRTASLNSGWRMQLVSDALMLPTDADVD